MILPTNAFNWAALRSGLSTGDFIASLTPEREEQLFKQYNEWRRSKGLAEEKALAPAPISAPENRRKEDALSALFSQVADEVVAEEAALVQDALDGADGIVEEELEAHAPIPAEVEDEAAQPAPEEVEVEIETDEPVAADEPLSAEELVPEDYAPEAATTPAVANEAEPVVDFAAVIRSLPKEAAPELYRGIKAQFGEETLTLAQAALKKATAKHRGTSAIRAFIAWLNENEKME